MGTARTHYLNADFDVSLRAAAGMARRPGIVRQVAELSLQALLGTAGGDAALVRDEVPEPFLDHLDDCGLNVPRVLRHPASDPATRLSPFGWSAEAIELNRGQLQPSAHPPLEVVRRVNGRSFGLDVERELRPDGPHGTIVRDAAQLDRLLAGRSPTHGWLLKAEHGNAGLGNRRVRSGPLSPGDRRFIERQLDDEGRLLVEPWLARTRDWSTVFDVPFDTTTCRTHRPCLTADGATVGAWFEPEPSCPYRDELNEIAARLAARLTNEGYHGPVCLDSFEWRDEGRVRLRPIVDLNCRHAVSDGVHRAWRASFPQRTVLYRFISRRRLTLPADQSELLAALGDTRYRPGSGRGVLLAAPDTARARVALLFVGLDRNDTIGLERAFIERFERRRT